MSSRTKSSSAAVAALCLALGAGGCEETIKRESPLPPTLDAVTPWPVVLIPDLGGSTPEGEVIKRWEPEAGFVRPAYGPLIAALEAQGYGGSRRLDFGYDWRLAPDAVATELGAALDAFRAGDCACPEAGLLFVAHGYGARVLQALLEAEPERRDAVARIIEVGAAHQGSLEVMRWLIDGWAPEPPLLSGVLEGDGVDELQSYASLRALLPSSGVITMRGVQVDPRDPEAWVAQGWLDDAAGFDIPALPVAPSDEAGLRWQRERVFSLMGSGQPTTAALAQFDTGLQPAYDFAGDGRTLVTSARFEVADRVVTRGQSLLEDVATLPTSALLAQQLPRMLQPEPDECVDAAGCAARTCFPPPLLVGLESEATPGVHFVGRVVQEEEALALRFTAWVSAGSDYDLAIAFAGGEAGEIRAEDSRCEALVELAERVLPRPMTPLCGLATLGQRPEGGHGWPAIRVEGRAGTAALAFTRRFE